MLKRGNYDLGYVMSMALTEAIPIVMVILTTSITEEHLR